MDVKVEVLSKKFQDWWRFSKIDGEVILSEDMMKMHLEPNGPISTPRRIHLSHPRENEVIQSKWSRLIPSHGRWLNHYFRLVIG